MTLQELMTPFERRRVIEYGKDGNKVVHHWYEVQQVDGAIYKTRDFPDEHGTPQFKLCIFFEGIQNGLRWQWMSHPGRYTVEQIMDAAKRDCVDSMTTMLADLFGRIEAEKFIGNAQIEFVRQFDPTAADRFAKHREDYYAKKEEDERRRQQECEAEAAAEKARQQAELEAAKAKYLGWADTMSPMRFGKVDGVLGSLVRCDGKVMTRREFVIQAVKDGWTPEQRDGVTSWYGSRWEPKQSKPKTEYCLVKENFSYKVSKTEFDFALYIVEHKEVWN